MFSSAPDKFLAAEGLMPLRLFYGFAMTFLPRSARFAAIAAARPSRSARFAAIAAACLISVAAAAQPAPKKKISPQDVRPPADIVTDCAKAPAGAVVKLPEDLASWAIIYCTKNGHIFNANDKHFAAFSDNGLRASFDANLIDGKAADAKDSSYFKSVRYSAMTPADVDALAKIDPVSRKIIGTRKPMRLDLTTSGGKTLSLAVLDAGVTDPFWVFPITDKGLGSPAFFVTTLETLNRTR